MPDDMVRPWYYCLLFMASFYLHWEDQMILCQHWVYLIKMILHLYYSNISMAMYLWSLKDQVLPLRTQEWQIDYLSMLCFNCIFLCVNVNRKACFPCEKWKKKNILSQMCLSDIFVTPKHADRMMLHCWFFFFLWLISCFVKPFLSP